MQHFFLLSTCFLGLIFSDFGPTTRVVFGKAASTPSTLLGKLQEASQTSSSSSESPISTSPLSLPSSSQLDSLLPNKITSTLPPPLPSISLGKTPQKLPKPQPLAQVQNDAVQNLNMADLCVKFTNGSHSEFYSPLYPNNYAPGADCYKIISAGPGQVIKIKFLDHFHIEYEEHCNYDFLEIRDGRFGYSTVIQKVCGTFPPPSIQSSGRHLWLRFHSDSDIQYIGFKAVYEFLPSNAFKPDLDECALSNTKLDDYIGTANISQEVISNARAYEAPIDCTWMIHAGENEKIYITFDKYDLEKPNDCTYNFIEVYGSQTELTDDSRVKQYCGSKAEAITSKGNILYIRFYSMIDKKGNQELKSNFEAYYSFFRDRTELAPCRKEEDEFDCTDNTCIDKSLLCNSKPNCKLRNDEENCPKRQTGDTRYDIPVIASIGCVLILGMCGGLFLNIYRKIRQDRKDLAELKEALRKSRESMLAMQIQSGIVPLGSAPQISSQDSGESRQTVVRKLEGPPEYQQPPTIAGGNGTKGRQGMSPGGGTAPQQLKTRSNGGAPSAPPAPPPPPPPPLAPNNNKQFRVQAEVTNQGIPYSPPPPYVSTATSPKAGGSKSSRTSDTRKEPPHPPPHPPPEEEDTPGESGEVCIEVRDSACQTRESFLAQLRGGGHPSSRGDPFRTSKAPLARGEAIDVYDLSTSLPSKRFTRPRNNHFDFPSHLSVSSTTSSTDLAERGTPSGSLENIQEYHE